MATYTVDTLPSKLQAGDIINCPYSGSIKSISLPVGTFTLECWGGKGGNSYSGYLGGNGGYSVGTFVNTTNNCTVYLVCGGVGLMGVGKMVRSGGYNGGGNSGFYYGGSGGGATHIALVSGLLSSLSSTTNKILIVAGAGGGAGDQSGRTGGAGGGTSGGNGIGYSYSYNSGGGTQSSGGSGSGYETSGSSGSFGAGGDATSSASSRNRSGGGGAGYYGGGGGGYYDNASQYSKAIAGGGGGSGYVNTSLLTNASTTKESTSTNPDTTNYAGYIRITVIEVSSSVNLRSKINNTWKDSSSAKVKIDGVWKDISAVYIKKEGDQPQPIESHIYGAIWDGSQSSAWTRTDDAADFEDPVPAVNNGDGSSPFDNCYPWNGMQKIEDEDAGVVVSIPKFWYKWTRDDASMKLQISTVQREGFYVSPAHADRDDGIGQRDVVYVGAYHCASTYKSTTGVLPINSITRATARTNIHNLGSTIWQWDYAMLWTIRMLYLVQFADWNSQSKIGYGCGNNSSTVNMGQCDSMTYHTGTSTSNRTTYGYTRYRWIEGLWDNVYDWVDGIYFNNTNIYCIKNPSNFSDSSGGTNIGSRNTTSSWITTWTNPSTSGFEYALYPSNTSGGSDSTYITDYCTNFSSGVVLRVGGDFNQYQKRGLFHSYSDVSASDSDDYFGSRLMMLPDSTSTPLSPWKQIA